MAFEPRINWAVDERGVADKTQWSNFWIMINTNQAGDNEFERSHLVNTLRRAVNDAFSTRTNIIRLLHVIDGAGEPVENEVERMREMLKIEKVDSEAVIEIGPTVHRVHAHVLLMVQHKTRIQLNVAELRNMIRNFSIEDKVPLFANPIVRVKLIRENPLNAIRKYQRGYKAKIPLSLINKVQASRV